jgi:hypothetical protein
MGIDVAQSPQRYLASFICHHHGIYTYIASWLLTWNFSLETVKASKNELRCSIYRYTADQWAQEGVSFWITRWIQWAVHWDHAFAEWGSWQTASFPGAFGRACCVMIAPRPKALDTTCGMFALKVGLLGSVATLLYELFAGFSDLEAQL